MTDVRVDDAVGKGRSAPTRRALVGAAVEVLRTEGYARATARRVAEVAGCNQGLVFYHFGTVDTLLLAALDEVSDRRRSRYDAAVADVHSPSELVDLAARIFAEDLDSGDATLLVEMIAAAASRPGLGAEVKARVVPWTEFATGALAAAFEGSPLLEAAGADELAYALVSLYLGLELMSHLDGDRTQAQSVFERAKRLAAFADLLARPSAGPPNTISTKEQP